MSLRIQTVFEPNRMSKALLAEAYRVITPVKTAKLGSKNRRACDQEGPFDTVPSDLELSLDRPQRRPA